MPRTKISSPPSNETATLTWAPCSASTVSTEMRGCVVGVSVAVGVPVVVGVSLTVRVRVTVTVCAAAGTETTARASSVKGWGDGCRNVFLVEAQSRETLHQNGRCVNVSQDPSAAAPLANPSGTSISTPEKR